MAAPLSAISISDLRGGQSDEHPATIAPNQVYEAVNVDYFVGTLGGRRNGSTAVVSGLASDLCSLLLYTPTSTASADQMWTIDEAGAWKSYDAAYTPTVRTPSPADTYNPLLSVVGASLHGKLFVAASTLDGVTPLNRLHVWDGTTFRRTGMAAPVLAPNVADTGVGTFANTRYYRVRFAALTGSTVLRRSEPSPETTFVPSGTGLSARITKPAAVNEGETHWEVEESINNADWYRIATVVVGTTTYDDSLAKVAVASSGVLSADIGDYSLQGSYRYLAVDRDRLIGFGNHTDITKDSDVSWTPVGTDPAGVGNDERVPTDVQNTLSLDGQDGGPITDGRSFDGRVIAFKMHRTYSLTNTSIRSATYLPQPASKTYGAMPGSVVEGVDSAGHAALYFIDSKVGPMRLGASGFEKLCKFLQKKFLDDVNFEATFKVVNAVYHGDKAEVWWHLAGTGSNVPSFRWVYNVDSGGSSFHTLPEAVRATMMWNDKPHVATDGGKLVSCDTENATTDYGNNFRAYITTRAYELGDLIKRFRFTAAMVEASAHAATTISVQMIRDYGLESSTARTVDLAPTVAAEPYVIKSVDDAFMSEATALQVTVGDAAAVAAPPWQLFRLSLKLGMDSDNV